MVNMCLTCGKISKTIGFNRDDPVLECGHTQPYVECKAADEMREKMFKLIDEGYTVWDAIVKVLYE